MPVAAYMKRRKGYRKRYNRKKRRYNRRGNLVTKQLTGFPKNQVVKMRYSNWLFASLAALPNGYYEIPFAANNINSPDTVPGPDSHRPMGYNQWLQFYRTFTVLGSRMTVSATSSSGDALHIIVSLLVSNEQTTVNNSISNIIETGRSSYQIMQNSANGLPIVKSVRQKYSAKRWHNVEDVKDADTLEGVMDAVAPVDPTDPTYYILTIQPYDQDSVATGQIHVTYTIDYIVMLKDPKEIAAS